MLSQGERLATAYQNVLQILTDRGYDIGESNRQLIADRSRITTWIASQPSVSKARGQLSFPVERKDGKRTYIHFAPETQGKVSVDEVTKFCQLFNYYKCHVGIFVTIKPLNTTALERLRCADGAKDIHIQVFLDETLLYNPTEGVLVSQTRILTPEEKEVLLKKVSPQTMPRIYLDDPIIKWYGGEAGQIVEERAKENFPEILVSKTIIYRFIIQRTIIKK